MGNFFCFQNQNQNQNENENDDYEDKIKKRLENIEYKQMILNIDKKLDVLGDKMELRFETLFLNLNLNKNKLIPINETSSPSKSPINSDTDLII